MGTANKSITHHLLTIILQMLPKLLLIFLIHFICEVSLKIEVKRICLCILDNFRLKIIAKMVCRQQSVPTDTLAQIDCHKSLCSQLVRLFKLTYRVVEKFVVIVRNYASMKNTFEQISLFLFRMLKFAV